MASIHDDLLPNNTPEWHTPPCLATNSDSFSDFDLGAREIVEGYGDPDAEDEVLTRWKASLGLRAASGVDLSEPKVASLSILSSHPLPSSIPIQLTVLGLELASPSLPEGKSIKLDFSTEEKQKYYENNPIQVKERAPYK